MDKWHSRLAPLTVAAPDPAEHGTLAARQVEISSSNFNRYETT